MKPKPVLLDDCFQAKQRDRVVRELLGAERLLSPDRKGMTDEEIIQQAARDKAIVLTRDKGFLRHWRWHGRSFPLVIVETDAANSKWPEMLWVAIDSVEQAHQPLACVLSHNRRRYVWA